MILWLTDKTSHAAITSYFKAAEYILEHHQPPPVWSKQKVSLLRKSSPTNTPKERILKRMDDLILFFEHCQFFQDETAREELLKKLNDERLNWEHTELT